MLHRERFKPPSRDYPADEWNVMKRVTWSSCHVGKPSRAILNLLMPIAGLAAIILNTTACSSR